MAATTNFQINNTDRTKFLAPRFSKKTITIFVFGYLLLVTVILFLTARPFQSGSALDFEVAPQPVSYSPYVAVKIPGVQVPTAPYIHFDPDTNKIVIALENPQVTQKASDFSHQAAQNGIEGANDSVEILQTGLRESH